ncbi:MAG: hypothetical protein ACOZCL_11385 [Bacillota bacterium]
MKKVKLLLMIMLTAAILAAQLLSPGFAWYGSLNPYGDEWDVHGDDTEQWCLDNGMSTFWAKKVAISCESVDVLFRYDYKWHLDRRNFTGDSEDTRILQSENEMTIAKRKLKEAYDYSRAYAKASSKWTRFKLYAKIKLAKEEAAIYLGRSLHPVQDMYAHMDAGVNTPDSEIGISHGMLDADMVDVKVYYPNGEFEIRQMKLEEIDSNGVLYSLYDDKNYDYVEEEWIFKQDMNKEENSRWIKTRDASIELIQEFVDYADELDISFTF